MTSPSAAPSAPSAAQESLGPERLRRPVLSRTSGRFVAIAGGAVVSLATALALVALAVPLFLNPAWVSFEQDRSRADALSGYTTEEVHVVTGSLLHDLVMGPGAFAATDAQGRTVLDDRERSHLQDVRTVFGAALVVAVVSVAVLVVGGVAAWRRPSFWRAVRRGAAGLALVVVVLGVVSVVAFDAAFEVFHRLFFASGSYTFDPQTSRLVQLFPDQFWSETTILLGLVLLVLAWDVHRFAGRRLERLTRATAP